MATNPKDQISNAPKKGARFLISDGLDTAVTDFLKKGLKASLFDAVLLPAKVPAGDSYAWVLTENEELIEGLNVLPPVMPVQGGKALSSLTKHGMAERKIAMVMRPCEVRAAIELIKLKQIESDNIFLISIDCPGVLPLKDYLEDSKKGESTFEEAVKSGNKDVMRPVCQTCVYFSMTAPDLHIATFGMNGDAALIIPASGKGEELLESAGMKVDDDTAGWITEVEKLTEQGMKARVEAHKRIKAETGGIENLAKTLDKCIACHNCMRVCPVCYCRRCYFDSGAIEYSSEQYLNRAKQKGSIKFSPDVLLFHIGRMSHMTTSCVSCGNCEDACPVSIPVAQLFSFVADDAQAAFDYVSGRNVDEPLPLRIFIKEEELSEIERICKDPLEQGE